MRYDYVTNTHKFFAFTFISFQTIRVSPRAVSFLPVAFHFRIAVLIYKEHIKRNGRAVVISGAAFTRNAGEAKWDHYGITTVIMASIARTQTN